MKKIPISKAKEIANEYDYSMVIIIGINSDRSGHITTYGKDQNFCKIAGHIGQKEIGHFIFDHTEGLLSKLDSDKISEIIKKTDKE